MRAWLDDEYAVEWALCCAAADARADTQPVPASRPTRAPRPAPVSAPKRHRPQVSDDDYYARRAKEECARMRMLFDRNAYRRELAEILRDANARQVAWEKEHVA